MIILNQRLGGAGMKERLYRYGLVAFGCAFWLLFRMIYG